MGIKFSDIEDAYLFVSMGMEFSNQAILCKETGKIFYASEYDDEDEIPEDVYENDECIEIPDKNELDLGKKLVFDFVEENLPEMYERVRRIFRKRGAYARYKDLLEEKGLLQRWYDFENDRQTQALKEWCADNEIELDG
jgi:uncharacterized protein UPF0158